MTLPHPDLSKPSPWSQWPAHVPQPAAAVHTIEEAGDETRDMYRATMPNGATAEAWTVVNSWDGDDEHRFAGEWGAYGLAFDEDLGILAGHGSEEIYAVLEEWADQDRGLPCEACRCSGRIAAYPFVSVHDSWLNCPACKGAGWLPHATSSP